MYGITKKFIKLAGGCANEQFLELQEFLEKPSRLIDSDVGVGNWKLARQQRNDYTGRMWLALDTKIG
jgi:hypothetical protein